MKELLSQLGNDDCSLSPTVQKCSFIAVAIACSSVWNLPPNFILSILVFDLVFPQFIVELRRFHNFLVDDSYLQKISAWYVISAFLIQAFRILLYIGYLVAAGELGWLREVLYNLELVLQLIFKPLVIQILSLLRFLDKVTIGNEELNILYTFETNS